MNPVTFGNHYTPGTIIRTGEEWQPAYYEVKKVANNQLICAPLKAIDASSPNINVIA